MEPALLITLIVIGVVVLALVIWVWATYNGLTKKRVRVEESWSDILVQLKRRADLIPNLVSAVSGYAKHEQGVFEEVTRARAATVDPQNPAQASEAENQLQGALRSLFAVAEGYPQLQANSNFVQLQRDLVQTEDKIQSSRRYYNGSVRELNTATKVFPNNLLAGVFGFHEHEFFDVADRAAISEPPRVQF